MRESRAFHRPWASAPTDAARFAAYLEDSRRPDFEAFLVCRTGDDHDHWVLQHLADRAGVVCRAPTWATPPASATPARVTCVRRLELVLRAAFLELRLHRLEANIQPGNQASIALARGAGFQREGFSPRYLKISGRWRDHERWALLAEDWRLDSGLS